MKARETYVWELEEWEDSVDRIIRLERNLPGSGHRDEDRLLERYVRERAYEGDARARTLLRLLDWDRRRWYA